MTSRWPLDRTESPGLALKMRVLLLAIWRKAGWWKVDGANTFSAAIGSVKIFNVESTSQSPSSCQPTP